MTETSNEPNRFQRRPRRQSDRLGFSDFGI
jgi:hypothetical protein